MHTTAFDDTSPDAPYSGRETSAVRLPPAVDARALAASDGRQVRSVHFHDPHAPRATAVVPSVFVAVRGPREQLLLVRRCDSGSWELPGGRVDVGESAVSAARRETAEEAGVQAEITGLVGLYTDPDHVVRAIEGAVRQQFVVIFRARPVGGTPSGDGRETCEAMWVAPQQVHDMNIEPPVRRWIHDALRSDGPPRLA